MIQELSVGQTNIRKPEVIFKLGKCLAVVLEVNIWSCGGFLCPRDIDLDPRFNCGKTKLNYVTV